MLDGTGPSPAEVHSEIIHLPSSCMTAEVDGTNYVHGTINNQKVTMLVDTGSAVTITSAKLYHSLNQPLPLKPVSVSLRSVDSNSLSVLGQVNVPLVIGGTAFSHDVIVAELAPELLFGIDFMRKNHCMLDFGKKVYSCWCKVSASDDALC